MFTIEVIAEELRDVVAGLDPATFAGRDAARLTKVCAEVERLGAAAKVLFARRAVETNGWVHDSRAVSGDSATPVARVRVDLPALLAGETSPGEVCEIPGVGPVPVDHARKILSRGLLELVITDGVDVQCVVSKTRHVPEALKVAIAERDERCKIRGCDATHGLERHHTLEFAEHHLTTYELLGMLCGAHHDLVTYQRHEIADHHDGTWSLRPAEHRDTHAA